MAIDKYLRLYAEPEAQQTLDSCGRFAHCVVIPCRDEPISAAERIRRFISARPDTLVMVLVNQPESQSDSALNVAFYQYLQKHSADNLLLMDRFSAGHRIPDRLGVGLARKIGCDIACRLIHRGFISSQWIHTSDADVDWPDAYPLRLEQLPADTAAACYPFQHNFRAEQVGNGLKLYELSLHYYVAGLQFAGSPYAYHSLGSTLAIHFRNYCAVRGFPKRAAGEDFHILNKLRKTGNVHTLQQPLLRIMDRDSNRVPFGTGPAVAKINALDCPEQQFLFYHPHCFVALRAFLKVLPELWPSRSADAAIVIARGKLGEQVIDGLLHCGLEKCLTHAFAHSSDQNGWQRHINNHFDALSTLRFIHYQRDHYFPSINLQQLREHASFYRAELAQFGLDARQDGGA